MNNQVDLLKKALQDKWNTIIANCFKWWIRNQRRAVTVMLLMALFQFKNVSFSIQMNSPTASAQPVVLKEPIKEDRSSGFWGWVLKNLEKASPVQKESTEEFFDPDDSEPPKERAEEFNVLEFLESSKPKLTAKQQAVRNRQIAYAKQFANIAKQEMDQFGIPASITIAQGIVETNAGISRLATQNNNHFGMKCFSKRCAKNHCSNFNDDHHKDFFRKYKSTWESYRGHSKLLAENKRYKFLFDLEKTDYRGWAHGLKKAGYATDKRYAQKLIQVIEDLKLHRLDNSQS